MDSQRTANNEANAVCPPLLIGAESVRRHTLQMLRRKSAMVKNQENTTPLEHTSQMNANASATMKLPKESLADRLGKALAKQVKQLHDLNQSAVFTLRKSSNVSRSSPKGSQLNMPQRFSSIQDESADRTPSPGADSSTFGPSPPT